MAAFLVPYAERIRQVLVIWPTRILKYKPPLPLPERGEGEIVLVIS